MGYETWVAISQLTLHLRRRRYWDGHYCAVYLGKAGDEERVGLYKGSLYLGDVYDQRDVVYELKGEDGWRAVLAHPHKGMLEIGVFSTRKAAADALLTEAMRRGRLARLKNRLVPPLIQLAMEAEE